MLGFIFAYYSMIVVYSFLYIVYYISVYSFRIYLNTGLIQSQTPRRQEIKVLKLSGGRCYTLVFHYAASPVGLEIELSSGICFRFTVIYRALKVLLAVMEWLAHQDGREKRWVKRLSCSCSSGKSLSILSCKNHKQFPRNTIASGFSIF